MSGNTVKNILSIWVFVALIGLGVGLALFISKVNSAPEDSQASPLATAIELGIQNRPEVSVDNQTLFNVGDTIVFNVDLPTLPTTGGPYKTLVLRVQYIKANFTQPTKVFEYDSSKYQGLVVATTALNCKPIDATYTCLRLDLSNKAEGASFKAGETVAKVNLTASTITPAAGAKVIIYPASGAQTITSVKDSYSYIINEANRDDIYVFASSATSVKTIKVENQCYGDYNRVKGQSSEIVDPLDLSRFASNYGIPLTGANLELDIDDRDASKGIINLGDLEVFRTNYGQPTCLRNRSNGLPW